MVLTSWWVPNEEECWAIYSDSDTRLSYDWVQVLISTRILLAWLKKERFHQSSPGGIKLPFVSASYMFYCRLFGAPWRVRSSCITRGPFGIAPPHIEGRA